jgi:hypothetical protein
MLCFGYIRTYKIFTCVLYMLSISLHLCIIKDEINNKPMYYIYCHSLMSSCICINSHDFLGRLHHICILVNTVLSCISYMLLYLKEYYHTVYLYIILKRVYKTVGYISLSGLHILLSVVSKLVFTKLFTKL